MTDAVLAGTAGRPFPARRHISGLALNLMLLTLIAALVCVSLTIGYVDYSVGVTYTYDDWVFGGSVVSTNKKDWYQTSKGRDAGRTGVVFSVARAF